MNRISVIGIDRNRLPEEAVPLLEKAGAVFCGQRFAPLAAPFLPPERIRPVTPLADALRGIRKELVRGPVAVLASGDPLFFGIGSTLLRHFDREAVHIIPAVSSMQRAFAACALPWDKAAFVSLHGRPLDNILMMARRHHTLCLLTDATNTPSAIAATLCANSDCSAMTAWVVENAGLAGQRVTRGSLREISSRDFAPLNIMILVQGRAKGEKRPDFSFGLTEKEIRHSRGLITKNEVRAAVIHRLRLPEEGVFWDIGAGSGSISIEAARLFPGLRVFACEKNREEQANIRANIDTFQATNITPVCGEAPAALTPLPEPDRVFVGGSGGQLEQIINKAVSRLAKHAIIVVSAVTEATANAAPMLLHQAGLRVETATISVSRSGYPPSAGKTATFNPITIISGSR